MSATRRHVRVLYRRGWKANLMSLLYIIGNRLDSSRLAQPSPCVYIVDGAAESRAKRLYHRDLKLFPRYIAWVIGFVIFFFPPEVAAKTIKLVAEVSIGVVAKGRVLGEEIVNCIRSSMVLLHHFALGRRMMGRRAGTRRCLLHG